MHCCTVKASKKCLSMSEHQTALHAHVECETGYLNVVIYDARLKGTKPDIKHIKNKIKWEVEVEYNTAIRRNKQRVFEEKWGPLIDILTNTN